MLRIILIKGVIVGIAGEALNDVVRCTNNDRERVERVLGCVGGWMCRHAHTRTQTHALHAGI